MKKITTLFLTMLMGLTAWAEIPVGYYTNAIGKQGEELMTALEGIIYTHSILGYNDLWDCYPYTDLGDDGYIIDMYSTCKYLPEQHVATASAVGQGLNREHSFPKSWFGGEVYPMYTDLTMIIPADGYVNQRRNNNPYGVCAGGVTYTNEELGVSMLGKLGKSTYDGYTSTVYEPDDEYKGDFARIYFYMVTCYKSQVGTWPGCDQLDYAANGYKAFSDWSMQMLMEWHRADPVSPKEIARNEAIYSSVDTINAYINHGQGNRNPFVDHPELAEYIWGTKQNEAWDGEGTPIDPLDKEVPVMKPVDETAVKGTSFRADWTAVDNVSSYTLKVSRLEEIGATLLMSETFSKINAYSDGRDDVSGLLDNYTDNPGWTGAKLYLAANHSLKFGTASVSGYLISPELPLSSTITIQFNAKNWKNSSGVSDNSTVIVSCGNVSSTVALTDAFADYTVVLNGCTENKIKLSGTSGNKRFYVSSVDIYNGDLTTVPPRREIVEEGDSTWRMVSGINDSCYTVKELAEGYYEYMVKAIYVDGTESVWSNIEHVVLTGEGDEPLIGDVNGDGEVSIADVTALIDYLLGHSDAVTSQEAADVNQDMEVTIADVTTLIDLLLSGEY